MIRHVGNVTVSSVVDYLLAHDVIGSMELVSGPFRIVDVSGRNTALFIERCGKPSLVLKQWPDRDLAEREAGIYRICRTELALRALGSSLPRVVAYIPEDAVLITEFVDAVPLHYESVSAVSFENVELAVQLAQTLANVHAVRIDTLTSESRSLLQPQIPWVLSCHKPGPAIFATVNPGGLAMLRILQAEPGLTCHLEALAKEYCAGAMVHGDVRSANVLVKRGTGLLSIVLIDWEFAHGGDPAWDVGCTFCDVLLPWVAFLPSTMSRASTVVQTDDDALERARAFGTALWSTYRSVSQLDAAESRSTLTRSLRYCAARLIQRGFESVHRRGMDENALRFVQLANSLFSRPELAARSLFGVVR